MDKIRITTSYDTYEFMGEQISSGTCGDLGNRFYKTDKNKLIIVYSMGSRDSSLRTYDYEFLKKRYEKDRKKSNYHLGTLWCENNALVSALKNLGFDYTKQL